MVRGRELNNLFSSPRYILEYQWPEWLLITENQHSEWGKDQCSYDMHSLTSTAHLSYYPIIYPSGRALPRIRFAD
jgi:hypothetical protein